ncbi:hypothetical protein [Poriferisphaera sp. WC338]|uniref:hypothetical protein n=1 Tax=Poriferisphaera sp. WC338 TaxID=3425129 RepID=UPI003D817171
MMLAGLMINMLVQPSPIFGGGMNNLGEFLLSYPILHPIVQCAVVILLLWKSDAIAKRIFPYQGIASTSQSLNSNTLLTLGFALLGMWQLVIALTSIVGRVFQDISQSIFISRQVYATQLALGDTAGTKFLDYVPLIFQLILGTLLLLGSKAIANFIAKLRTLGTSNAT